MKRNTHVGLSLIFIVLASCGDISRSNAIETTSQVSSIPIVTNKSILTWSSKEGQTLRDGYFLLDSGSITQDSSAILAAYMEGSGKQIFVVNDTVPVDISLDLHTIRIFDQLELKTTEITVDSSFFLDSPSHFALSRLNINGLAREVPVPIVMTREKQNIKLEGRISLSGGQIAENSNLKDSNIHLGFVLYGNL